MYDLLIINGKVVDPSQKINEKMDIAVTKGKVERISRKLDESEAELVIDAENRIVTPGLIDMHVHIGPNHAGKYAGRRVSAQTFISSGVTSIVDAGTYGHQNFPLIEPILKGIMDRLFIFLNAAPYGTDSIDNERAVKIISQDDIKNALQTCNANPELIKGIKVLLSKRFFYPYRAKDFFYKSLELSRTSELPLMAHGPNHHEKDILDGFTLNEILNNLESGDILTHCLGNKGIVAWDAIDEAKEAEKRGVYFDVGHGSGSFSFAQCKSFLDDGLIPSIISTDLHQLSLTEFVFDLPTTLSKFLALGLSLEEVIQRATINPAEALGVNLGKISPGSPADISILELRNGDYNFEDSYGYLLNGSQMLFPIAAIKRGEINLASSWRQIGFSPKPRKLQKP